MVLRRPRADDDDAVAVLGCREWRRHRAGVQPLHERGHRGCMAQPRAMIDVVGAETLPDQLLEQIGLLVGAFGRAEAGDRLAAVARMDALQPRRSLGHRLLPGRLAEVREHLLAPDLHVGVLGDAVAADQRLGQAVGVVDVVEAEAALDAQPVGIGRPVATVDVEDLLVLDVHRRLAADTAVGAQRVDRLGLVVDALAGRIEQALLHQRAGRAHLHALAAGDAGRLPHALVEVEHHLGAVPAEGHADHVVGLHLAAGAHAQPAVDAGVEIDGDGRMRRVGRRAMIPREAAGRRDAHGIDPAPELGSRIVARLAPGLVGHQQLEHHLARLLGPLARRLHLHARGGLPLTGGGQHALALHLDHARAAVAVGAIAGRRVPAQVRDLGAVPLRDLPDGLARLRLDLAPVQRECDLGHGCIASALVWEDASSGCASPLGGEDVRP